MLVPMVGTQRIQSARSAAIIAAAMLLTMALAAASGVPNASTCSATCSALRSVAIECVPAPMTASDASMPRNPNGHTPGENSPGSVACVSTPAGWRTLDLPPPAR
jgi:hypothetical protein